MRDLSQFEQILDRAKKMGLEPRSEPPLNSRPGAGRFERAGKTFLNFYVLDPAGSNVELMVFI